MEPRVEIVVVVEVVIAVVSVTSTGIARILEEGKSVFRAWMAGWEVWRVEGRSQRAMPEAPCSSKARVVERARVPAPPVTFFFFCVSGGVCDGFFCFVGC
jgi:hypothetical protein